MPMLLSYRNQSIDLHSKLTGFYMRAILAFNGLTDHLHISLLILNSFQSSVALAYPLKISKNLKAF